MPISISVVMPCLNEASTLGFCIKEAQTALEKAGVHDTEIIVADNGSTDGSQQLAQELGANVIRVNQKGYGSALHAGISAARYDWVFFADSDMSYDFRNLEHFIPEMHHQADLIVGNRFKGHIDSGAMPFLHRYLGTPVISVLGRRSFGVNLGDFNCGMRAIKKDAYVKLQMQSGGMEYASEMIAKAGLKKLDIREVPVDLRKDGRDRKPHLSTWQDGWKHLKLILLLSPKWLLLFPSLFFMIAGLLLGSILLFNYVSISDLVLDIHTLYYASIFFVVGFQLFQFYLFAKLHGHKMGIYPKRKIVNDINRYFSFENSLILGSIIFLSGIFLSAVAVWQWKASGFGPLDPVKIFRIIIPAGFCISIGIQSMVFGFMMYVFSSLKNNTDMQTTQATDN